MKETSKFAATPVAQTVFGFWYRITKAILFPSSLTELGSTGRSLFIVVLQFLAFSVLFGLALGFALPFAYLMEAFGLTVSTAFRIYFLTVIIFLTLLRSTLSPRLKLKIKTAAPESLLSKAGSYIEALKAFFDKTAAGPTASAITASTDERRRLINQIFKRNRILPQITVKSRRGAANDATLINSPIEATSADHGEGRQQIAKIHSIYFEIED